MFVSPDQTTITLDDMKLAFHGRGRGPKHALPSSTRISTAMSQWREIVCNEIHLEKKAIAASLKRRRLRGKEIRSRVSLHYRHYFHHLRLNGRRVHLGTAILGLTWMLQATAQEFLQSIFQASVRRGRQCNHLRQYRATMQGDDLRPRNLAAIYPMQEDARPRRTGAEVGAQHALHPQPLA